MEDKHYNMEKENERMYFSYLKDKVGEMLEGRGGRIMAEGKGILREWDGDFEEGGERDITYAGPNSVRKELEKMYNLINRKIEEEF